MLFSTFARSASSLAAVALLASQPVSAQANRVESPTRFSGSHTTINFEGLTAGEQVAEQFVAQGVHLSLVGGGAPFADFTTPANEFRSVAGGFGLIQNFEPGVPVSGGLEDFPDVIVTFDSPVNRVGFAIVTNGPDDLLLSVSCMCAGELVATEFFDTTFQWRFFGLETETPFDRIVVDAALVINAAFRIDDLSFENDPTVRVIDTVIPDVVITSPVDGALLCQTSALLSASVFDQGAVTVTSIPSGVTTTLPAGGGLVSSTVSLSEGQNTLSISATDPAGNQGGTSVSVFVDTMVPVLVVTPGEGAVVPPDPLQAFDPVRVLVRVTDASVTTVSVDGVSYQVPAGGGSVSASVNLVEGANAITISAADVCGNQASVLRTIVLDSTTPLVSINQPLDGTCVGPGQESVPVQVTINDLTQVTVYSVPAGLSGVVPAGGGVLAGAALVPEGLSTIMVFATDAAGNVSQASVSVALDTTPPTVSVVSPAAGDAIRGLIEFDGSTWDGFDGSGVARADLLVDGGVVATFADGIPTMVYDTTNLPDGTHTFSILSVDGKGLSATADIVATVDNTPPSVQFDDVFDGDLVGGLLSFQATGTDATSGVVTLRMTVDGGAPTSDGSIVSGAGQPVVTGTSQEDTTVRFDGPLLLTAVARDLAGNVATVSATVLVENAGPSKILITPTHGQEVSGVIEILAASDALDLASLEILVDDISLGTSASSPFSVFFNTLTLLDGTLPVTVVATDINGRSSTCTAEVTVENQEVEVEPRTFKISSKKKKKKKKARTVKVEVEGADVALLLPIASHSIFLVVPGGSPVPALLGFVDDDEMDDDDFDGIPEVTLKFDRQQVINALNAGIAGGAFGFEETVQVALVVDGRTIGEDSIRIRGK